MVFVRADGVKIGPSGQVVGRLTPEEMEQRSVHNSGRSMTSQERNDADASAAIRMRLQDLRRQGPASSSPDSGTISRDDYALEMPRSLPPMEARTRESMNFGTRSLHGRSDPSLLLPPTPDALSGNSLSIPGVAPAPAENSAESLASAQNMLDRRNGPKPIASARRATQQYAEQAREGARQSEVWNSAGDSGTLPGEEQVQTGDTLRQLSPQEQAALRKKYESGGHAGTMDYEDWLSSNFGDIPPQERASQMRASATATPRMSVGKDPTLPVGENSQLAIDRQAAGLPLPEGREAKQYTKEQLRTMSRNVHNPDIPMTRFGGTFTHNPGGALSARAPNPELLTQASAIAQDQGQFSDSHIIALAQAYGIDAQRYGDDIDMLRGDVMREDERHQQRMKNYTPVATGGGAFRYTPTDAFKDRLASQDRARLAGTIRNRYQGMMTPEQLAAAENAVGTPNGKEELVRLGQLLRRVREGNSHQDVRNRARNYNMTQDMRNPNYAPGMAVRSLFDAVDAGDPLGVAAVHDVFGNPAAAAQNRQVAIAQGNAASQLAGAEAEAAAVRDAAIAKQTGDEPDATLAEQQSKELERAYAMSNPADRYEAIQTYLEKVHPEWAPEQVAARAQELIAGRLARTNGGMDPFVQQHLQVLRRDKPKFLLFAQTQLNMTPEQAEQLYNSAGPPPMTAESAGRAVGGAIPALGQGAVDLGRGFGSGFVQGLAPPKK